MSPYNKFVTFMKFSQLQKLLEQDGWYTKGTQLEILKNAGLK